MSKIRKRKLRSLMQAAGLTPPPPPPPEDERVRVILYPPARALEIGCRQAYDEAKANALATVPNLHPQFVVMMEPFKDHAECENWLMRTQATLIAEADTPFNPTSLNP